MKVIFLIFIITTLVYGCTENNVKATKAKSADSYPVKHREYKLIFLKKLNLGYGANKKLCLAMYVSDGMYYTVQNMFWMSRGTYVNVYYPKNNLSAHFGFNSKGVNYCSRKADLNQMSSQLSSASVAELYYLTDGKLKHVLDNAMKNPQALEEVISGPSPSFNIRGYSDAVIKLHDHEIHNINQLDDVRDALKKISPVSSNNIYESQINASFQKKVEEAKEQDEYRQKRLRAEDRWNNRLSYSINKGDKVCTYEKNYFGYVEEKSGNKVKVYVIGSVSSEQNDGYFFKHENGKYTYDKMEVIRWFSRDEIGSCGFK